MTREKKETKKATKKIRKNSLNKFWDLLQPQLIDFGTAVLKKGIANVAISKIDDTEEKIQAVVEEKIQKHYGRIIRSLIKILSFIIAGSFITYAVLEIILRNFNLENYTNLIFGFIFLIIALVVNNKK